MNQNVNTLQKVKMTRQNPPLTELMRLPLWGEDKRALPTSFARSALFSVGGKATRRSFEAQTIASWPGTEIDYTGKELRSDDEDVLMQLFHRARGSAVDADQGIEVEFSGFSLLAELEWPTTKAYYEKLRNCLDRMQAGSVRLRMVINGKQTTFRGQMIRKYVMALDMGYKSQWKVWIEPEVIKLFSPSYLEIEWSQRKRLAKPFSKWLHGFMSSESTTGGFTAPEDVLFRLSGSVAASIRTFRASLKESLEEMRIQAIIFDWKLQDGMLFVAREPGMDINRAVTAAKQKFASLKQLEVV